MNDQRKQDHQGKQGDGPVYTDPSADIEQRIEDLLGQMTLEEKASQMLYTSPAIARLGVPEYNWWNECLHGVARAGRATVFPQAIGLAATFDETLVGRIADAISDEARAKHHAAVRAGNRGQYRGLTFWTPNVNIFRDPRWGRGQETYGEDPYLTARIGRAFVRGLQGSHPKYLKTAACAKHFAVHSGPERDRHRFDAVVTPKDLRETYLPAFHELVEEGVESVMGAYNRTNGEPCNGSRLLLVEILRGEWGFSGHVVSDCWAIRDFHEYHGVTKTEEESAALAVKMGCDLNCGCVFEKLLDAVKQGLLEEQEIDAAVRRLLRTRFRLGMFDPPELVPYASIGEEVIGSDEHRVLARRAAARSFVLLKNNGILPLRSDVRRILVTGPCAADVDALLANYHGLSGRLTTVLEGIATRADEGVTVDYRQGCLLATPNANPTNYALSEAKNADVVVAVFGITTRIEGEEGDSIESSEFGDRSDIALPENQLDYLRALKKCGTPIVAVIAGGSALGLEELHATVDAVLMMWYPGQEGGHAVADVLFGDVPPSGKLPVTFPRSIEQLPPFDEYSMAGRTYRYMEESPMYPFGFGLSYASFSFSDFRAPARIAVGEELRVECVVKNTGTVPADEVVQMYLTALDLDATPIASLKGFRRVNLEPNTSHRVAFHLETRDLETIQTDGSRAIMPGRYRVTIGDASPGKRSRELGAAEPVVGEFVVE